jgi:putative transcriptional regulator
MKNRLAEFRQQASLSVVALAEACQVSRQTIHAIESETFKPTVLLSLKLAKVLKVKVEDLFVLEKDDFK